MLRFSLVANFCASRRRPEGGWLIQFNYRLVICLSRDDFINFHDEQKYTYFDIGCGIARVATCTRFLF